MRFFYAPSVLLALGVAAVAGHSYHAFEHGYQPVVSYGGLPKFEDIIHEGHIARPYDILNAAPVYHEDVHLNREFDKYLEPHSEHYGLENHDVHSHHELSDFGHHDHHEHHENYVLHGDHEHKVKYDHKEEHKHHEALEEHEHGHEEHDHGHEDKQKSVPKYEFKYGVNDPKTGDVKEQWESRTGDKVKGGYALKESDGTTRVVHYSADKKKGFEATVHTIGQPNEKHIQHGHHGH